MVVIGRRLERVCRYDLEELGLAVGAREIATVGDQCMKMDE